MRISARGGLFRRPERQFLPLPQGPPAALRGGRAPAAIGGLRLKTAEIAGGTVFFMRISARGDLFRGPERQFLSLPQGPPAALRGGRAPAAIGGLRLKTPEIAGGTALESPASFGTTPRFGGKKVCGGTRIGDAVPAASLRRDKNDFMPTGRNPGFLARKNSPEARASGPFFYIYRSASPPGKGCSRGSPPCPCSESRRGGSGSGHVCRSGRVRRE